MIVFCGFTAVVDALCATFRDQAVLLTGETSQPARQVVEDRFQTDPSCQVFVCNFLMAGTGITLMATTRVIVNDLDWMPANYIQAEDCAYRIGQHASVNVSYAMAEDTIDDIIWGVLERKARRTWSGTPSHRGYDEENRRNNRPAR